MEKTLDFYKNMIIKHLTGTKELDIVRYVDFCLNYVKENIIYCHNNNNPTNKVIVEIFKRGMAQKWALDHQR